MGLEKPVIYGAIGGNKVKHIQRGNYAGAIGNEYKVTLSGFSNVEKMVAIVNGVGGTNEAYIKSLNVNELVITSYGASSSTAGGISWQVVEFD